MESHNVKSMDLEIVEIHGESECGNGIVRWGFAIYDRDTTTLLPTFYSTHEEVADAVGPLKRKR